MDERNPMGGDEGLQELTDVSPAIAVMRDEVTQGLAASPKYIPSLYFYDDRGSALFEQITEVGDVQIFSHVEGSPAKVLPAPSRRSATMSAWASTKSSCRGFTPNSSSPPV